MAAVVRVKRRIDDDPVDSLVISCKRLKKTDESPVERNSDLQELTSLFKFAVTVPEQVVLLGDIIRKHAVK